MDAQTLQALAIQPRRAAEEARAWLLDCFDEEHGAEEIQLANYIGLVLGVERYYDGGYRQFLADSNNLRA